MNEAPNTAPVSPLPDEVTLLVVDDEPANLGVLNAVLQPYFRVRVARSGKEALRMAATAPPPALMLLDVMMPEMDGYMVLAKLRESPATSNLPVIFVTAMDSAENEQRGLELGAVDYITKPINPAIVLARVRTQLELKTARDRLAKQNIHLESVVTERTGALKQALEASEVAHAALKKSYFGTLVTINRLSALRSNQIGEHSRRVAELSRKVARDMGLGEAEGQDVFVAALLHDIGKVSFPDEMLNKPVSDLNPEQLAAYWRHPAHGAEVLGTIEALAGIAAIVRHHHERYDGKGFPDMLS